MEVLTEFFDDRVIPKGLWPPRLPEFSIQDFFLWGYLKNVTFRNKPHTLDELKSNILRAISDINSHTLRKVSIILDALGRRVAGRQPPNSPRTGKSSSGRVGQNPPTRD
ncbi:uncharacterized protein TNCV_370901 [Trichonephila clavipes]|nr:uncharacterized protein TNCV_370901 [Trichonephila clavipes]